MEKGDIALIKLLYEQIEKENNNYEKSDYMKYFKNNLFHIAINNNQFFPIIFFYEKIKNFYKIFGGDERNILDSNEENKEKMAPIHYACKNKNVKLMNLLIDLGADINLRDKKGYTPLHYAVVNNDERMVKHLLIRGANKFLKDENNLTPYNLSFFLGDKNISKILYHKNCCQKQFCGEEIGPISKKNNFRVLFIGLIITIIIKLSIIVRFYFLLNGISINISFLFSYTYNKSPTNNNIYSSKIDSYSIKDFFSCADEECVLEIGVLFFCLLIDFLLLFNFLLFKCSKNIFLPQKTESQESLIELFEENKNENICVKCRIVINEKTQHCLICNRCIENWDHHCFWLNTCINVQNYKKFRLFMISSILFLIFNLFFYLISTYLLFSYKDLFVEEFLALTKDGLAFKIIKIILICVFIYIIIFISYSLFFVVLPIIKYICKKSRKYKNQNKVKEKEKEVDYKSNNIIDNEDEDDIITIESKNKDL